MRIVEVENPPSVDALLACFAKRDRCFVLDSAQTNDGLGEWCFFGAEPFMAVSGKNGVDRVDALNGFELAGDFKDVRGLKLLRELMAPYRAAVEVCDIPFCGGAVGYLAYDYGRRLELVPDSAVDDRSLPDFEFGLYDGIAALNLETKRLYLVALGIRSDADTVIEELRGHLENAARDLQSLGGGAIECGDWAWNLSKEEFLVAVERIRSYIASGDVYQVNLSQRARARFSGDPLALYLALRRGNPAPYGAYLDTGPLQLFSTSPEQFLRKRGRLIETRPIKGTRPRTGDLMTDQIAEEDLKASEKDRAELLMIVDLERNDLGRVAEYGSVQVKHLYQLEHYARVIHQTAQVQAELCADLDVFDCIEAIFPGGSITGAPKIRAMEIIEELEPTRRGVYCGAIGYIGFNGDAELNIAIRSLHLTGGYLDYQVGAGIVWDSDPEAEYLETMDKGRAIRDTIDDLGESSGLL